MINKPTVEVLVATMGQKDFSLYDKMNLRCDCLIANQCGRWDYREQTTTTAKVRMISSDTVGVGINRNLALSNAKGDILLLADDDIVYYDGTLDAVAEAFVRFPDADVIAFGMDMTRKGELSARRLEPCKRRALWNSMRYGACRIAVRRSAVRKHSLSFSELFGGGCMYGSGEDTIFLRECFRKGLKVYSHSYVLGTCARDHSSWFKEYNAKFFYDHGAMLACAFPAGKQLIKWYFAWKLKKKTGVPLGKIIGWMKEGIRGFASLRPFEEPMTGS